ncbi:MAG: 4Fe-4S binding protein [Candidatus Alcyoniella australis]|nr:4Fe-4S binding protein [Candidatus Alcyoniella australis]
MTLQKQGPRTIRLDVDAAARTIGFNTASSPTQAHLRLARYYSSPLLMGPPRSELLLQMLAQMFDENEADLVQHLPPLRPRSAQKVAAKSGRPLHEVEALLDSLALTKKVILAAGSPRKYTILPIVPGTFEMALMTSDIGSYNSWHQRFAELFEELFETRYYVDYPGSRHSSLVRYLPVGQVAPSLRSAWPSDLLEQVLEPFDDFAVGHCQCRIAMQLVGKGCGKPTENCTVFGPMVKPMVERGMMRRIDRDELISIKREAEQAGCVTWMMNSGDIDKGNGSCSCCGCCCHALRMVRDFNTPGLISVPHFLPALDAQSCNSCGSCVRICPMDAWTLADGHPLFDRARCIGCGLCVTACKQDALHLEPLDEAKPPTGSWNGLLLKGLPSYLGNSVRVWAGRLFG